MRRFVRGATVLITGAGSGLGRAMALEAAARGARIVIWDLSASRGGAVRDEVLAAGGIALAVTVDVTDTDAVRDAAERTLAVVHGVDILINNAGVVLGRPLLESTEAAISRTFAVNTLAPYWVTRAFLPGMVDRGRGTVVTIASAAGLIGVARQTDYSASKHAAVGFTEALRAEMRQLRTGVSTLLVCPYYIDTGMFAGVRTRFPLLLPILREGTVAAAVLDAVESGRTQLSLPPLVRLLPVLRVLPVVLFDRLADVLGVNASMDHFTGRGQDVARPT